LPERKYRALLVVGSKPGDPLYADLVFQERLEVAGFSVYLMKDSEVQNQDCEAYDVMLVSASISGGYLGNNVNDCTTPQLIWEVGLYNNNMMAGPDNEDAWVTSPYWSTHMQDSWTLPPNYHPEAPTGADIYITEEGAKAALAAGLGPGYVPFFNIANYGMNWVNLYALGKGAKVVAILPPSATVDWNPKSNPQEHKAVLFYYEKGGELYGGTHSPGLRIGFPPYNFIYGSTPSCEELEGVPNCAACKPCTPAVELAAQDINPEPLSCNGVKLLDAAIAMLKAEAKKCLTGPVSS